MAFRVWEIVRAVLRELARTVMVPVIVAGRIVGWVRRTLAPPVENEAQAAADEAARAVAQKPVWTDHMTRLAEVNLVRPCLDAIIAGRPLEGQGPLTLVRSTTRAWLRGLTREEAVTAQASTDDELARHIAGLGRIPKLLPCTKAAVDERHEAETARAEAIIRALYAESAAAQRKRSARV